MEKILQLIKDEVGMGTYGLVELELRKLVEEKFTSTNTASAPCEHCVSLPADTVYIGKWKFCPWCGIEFSRRT